MEKREIEKEIEVSAKLNKDIDKYLWDVNHGGSFAKTVCKAIELADMNNLQLLYNSFPELVNGYIGHYRGLSWEEFKEHNQ